MGKSKKYIRDGKGKGVNAIVENESQARMLINEARPDLTEYETYSMGGKAGYELHPIEPGFNNDLPHIKWQDWSGGKSNGANGHIFFKGE